MKKISFFKRFLKLITVSIMGILPTAMFSSASYAQENKTLVVYFSMPETTNPNNMTREEENSTVVIDGKVLGNTQYVAQLIQEKIGADIFRLEPQIPYPTDHRTLVDLAKDEQDAEARPAIENSIDISGYDTVFLGYPNWWGDLPMIMYTFLEQYDLYGKTVIPFCTHGGSGFSRTIRTITQKQPQANVIRDGFSLSRNDMEDADEEVAEWLSDLGFIK